MACEGPTRTGSLTSCGGYYEPLGGITAPLKAGGGGATPGVESGRSRWFMAFNTGRLPKQSGLGSTGWAVTRGV